MWEIISNLHNHYFQTVRGHVLHFNEGPWSLGFSYFGKYRMTVRRYTRCSTLKREYRRREAVDNDNGRKRRNSERPRGSLLRDRWKHVRSRRETQMQRRLLFNIGVAYGHALRHISLILHCGPAAEARAESRESQSHTLYISLGALIYSTHMNIARR